MPGGLSLGGAFFTLYGDNAQILQTMAEAKTATIAATRAMADAQTAYAEAAKATSTASRAAWKAIGDSYVADAQRASASIKQLNGVLQGYGVSVGGAVAATEGFSVSLKALGATLATLSGFGAIASGALVAREAFLSIEHAAVGADEATRQLTASFGQSAAFFKQMADEQAAALGKSQTAAEKGIATLGILGKQYGFTADQIQVLTQRSIALQSAYGGDLTQVFHDVSNSMQGETQALEKYNVALQANVMQNSELLTEAQRRHYNQLSLTTQAQLRYMVFLQQTAEVETAAAQKHDQLAGALEKVETAYDKLATTLGRTLSPEMVIVATATAGALDGANKLANGINALYAAGEELGKEAGLPHWLSFLLSRELVVFTGAIGPLNQHIQELIENARRAQEQAGKLDEAAQAQQKAQQSAIAEHSRLLGVQRDMVTQIDALEKLATQRAVSAENEAYADKKAKYEDDKTAQIQAAEDKKKAALEGIAAEKQAAEELYQTRLAHLQKLKQGELQAAEDRHTAAVRGLEAEKQAVEEAEKLQVRGIEDARDAALEAGDDRKQAEIDGLNAVKRERDAARVREDRALSDQTEAVQRAAQDRHTAVTRGLEAEAVAIRHNAELETRALDETAKQAEAHHKSRLAQIEARGKAAEKGHADTLRHLETQGKAADEVHRLALARIEAETTAAKNGHDQQVRAIDDQLTAAKRLHDDQKQALADELAAATRVHDLRNRALADQVAAAQAVHDLANRGLEDQLAAATAVHAAILDGLDAEKAAATALHDRTVRNLADQLDLAEHLHREESDALDARSRAEDARHAAAMANLDAELKIQTAAIDAQLAALDQAGRTDTHTGRVADLKTAVAVAQSSGNAATIARAERDLAQETAGFERDQLKDTLQAAKDAVKDRIDAEKELVKARHDQIDDQIDDEKRLSDARLAATKDAVDAGKQLASDILAQTTAGIAARKDAADRQFETIRRTGAAQKQANDDALALIKAQADAARQANDDALAQVKDRIDARQRELDDALTGLEQDSADRKQALDDELARIQAQLATRKDQADEELRLTKLTLDGRKQAADDEYAKRKESLDKQKTAADEGYQEDKDRIDRRKQDVKDESDDLLAQLDVRKKGEEDRYQAEQRANQDTHDAALRTLQDRRTAEDNADQDRRTQVERAHADEQDLIKKTADLAIQASKDALAQYQADFAVRKTAVDDQYQNEQRQIRATYDDPETGLLARLKKAFDETKKQYDLRTLEVNKQYDNERREIAKTFDDKETGLFARLADVHQKTIDALQHTQEDWEKNFQKPIEDVVTNTLGTAQKAFDEFFKKNGRVSITSETDGTGGRQGGPGGDGPGPVPGGIPSPYRVTFPYDAPYNGPFAGGAMWAGGPTRHQGIDLALPGPNNGMGKPYGAFQPGTVYWKGYEPAGGNGMIIKTDDGLYNYYGHSQRFLVGTGQHVEAGQEIGILGESGTEGSPHLHYAVRTEVNSGHIDPVPYMTGGARHGGDDDGDPKPGTGVEIKDGYLVFTLFGEQYKIKLPAVRGTGPAGAKNADEEEVEAFIRKASEERRIDPEAALKVVDGEGGLEPMAVGDFVNNPPYSGMSYWPFQLHYAGGRHPQAGMGDDFTRQTGWQPADPTAWKASTNFALDIARDEGWARWYGRKKHNVGVWDGIERYAGGGVIPEPTLLVGQTLGPYAMAGESAAEWVTPRAPGTGIGHAIERQPLDINIGGSTMARIVVQGMRLEIRRSGALPGLPGLSLP